MSHKPLPQRQVNSQIMNSLISLASNQKICQIADIFIEFWTLQLVNTLVAYFIYFYSRPIIEITIATIIIHDVVCRFTEQRKICQQQHESQCHVSSDKLVGLSLEYHRKYTQIKGKNGIITWWCLQKGLKRCFQLNEANKSHIYPHTLFSTWRFVKELRLVKFEEKWKVKTIWEFPLFYQIIISSSKATTKKC